MGKVLILNKIKEFYKFKSDAEFAKYLGINSHKVKLVTYKDTGALVFTDVEGSYMLTPESLKQYLTEGRAFSAGE